MIDLYIQDVTQPMHQRLSDEFRRRVFTGEWPEGSKVPSESELCAEFEVSRGPVRQALAQLRQEGILAGGQGRQPIVRRSTPSQPVEVFLSFTEWVEQRGKTPGQKTFEIARRPAGTLVAAQLGIDPEDHIVALLRLRLIDGVPTMIERTHFVVDVGAKLFDFDTDSGSTFRYLRDQGVDLYSARHTIDAVAADATDVDLLKVDPGTPLLRERRVTSTATGRAIEYAEDRYLPDQTNFVVENIISQRPSIARIRPAIEESIA